jgi:hypothetical protein
MAKKIDRKLVLKRETLRRLDDSEMRGVVGGGLSGPYCTVGEASGRCGSMTQDCIEEETGGIVIKISG